MIQIRKAEQKDIMSIYNMGLNVNEFNTTDTTATFWPQDILKNIINSKHGYIFIAEADKQLVGFIIINYNCIFKKALIENIFVNPDYRQKDIAKKLLSMAKTEIKKVGCEYLCTLVEPSSSAFTFYLNNNFTPGKEFVWMDKIIEITSLLSNTHDA